MGFEIFAVEYTGDAKSQPIGVYGLASVLMRVETGFNSCFPPESLPIYPSERASVLMRIETAVPRHFCSVLYRKHVSRVKQV
jgi:hypothetical protein